jgi:hypothetical protein
MFSMMLQQYLSYLDHFGPFRFPSPNPIPPWDACYCISSCKVGIVLPSPGPKQGAGLHRIRHTGHHRMETEATWSNGISMPSRSSLMTFRD